MTVLVVAGVVYRWYAGYREEAGPPRGDEGPPLTSWRWVYDVDNVEAEREMANVSRQAEVLGEADEKHRK